MAQQQHRGMVNWDKIGASKQPQHGRMQPPHTPPPPPVPAPAQGPGTGSGALLANVGTLSAEQARAKLEELLSEPYLAVQRRLELANLIIGFEQVPISDTLLLICTPNLELRRGDR